jgi:hypothetical protein
MEQIRRQMGSAIPPSSTVELVEFEDAQTVLMSMNPLSNPLTSATINPTGKSRAVASL